MSKADIKEIKAGVKFDDIKDQLLEDNEFKDEYNKVKILLLYRLNYTTIP